MVETRRDASHAADGDAASRVSTDGFCKIATLPRNRREQFRVQQRLEFLVVGFEVDLQV